MENQQKTELDNLINGLKDSTSRENIELALVLIDDDSIDNITKLEYLITITEKVKDFPNHDSLVQKVCDLVLKNKDALFTERITKVD